MTVWLCRTCGIQHPDAAAPPERCAICEDDRQFVPETGQSWITREALLEGHQNSFRAVMPDVICINTPGFAIGQRAFLIRTPQGNVLWDCISVLDEATRVIVEGLGGLSAIALSHPHFYSAIASWGEAFDCPVFTHANDAEWIAEPSARIEHWTGENRDVLPGLTLHRVGGHFPGMSVLHWADRRAVFVGDAVLVSSDRKHVSFMWSYPNNAPLSASAATHVAERLCSLEFDSLHSAFWGRGEIWTDAKGAIKRSLDRHVEGRGSI